MDAYRTGFPDSAGTVNLLLPYLTLSVDWDSAGVAWVASKRADSMVQKNAVVRGLMTVCDDVSVYTRILSKYTELSADPQLPEVDELHIKRQIGVFEHRNDELKIVDFVPAHSYLVFLYR